MTDTNTTNTNKDVNTDSNVETNSGSTEHKSRKQAPKKKWSPLRIAILVVCAGVFVFAAIKLISIFAVYDSGDDLNESIAALNGETKFVEETNPDGQTLALPLKEINFDALRAINSDVKAWIQGPDTMIDNPIVQGYDNDEYLNRQFDNSQHEFGCLFMDYQNADDFSDDVTMIYGHHMKNGSMFASIVEYKSQEYYENHKYLILYTPTETYLLEPYAGATIDGENTFPLTYGDKEKYQNFLDDIQSRSDFKSGINITTDSKTVILYTCTYDYDSARYILCCRSTPLSEALR